MARYNDMKKRAAAGSELLGPPQTYDSASPTYTGGSYVNYKDQGDYNSRNPQKAKPMIRLGRRIKQRAGSSGEDF